jgi:transposase
VETNGPSLVEAITSIAGQRHVCLEEGTQSEWLYELLEPHAVEVVVTVPERQRGNKNDAKDAHQRAEELRIGSKLTTVFKPQGKFSGLRSAVRAYTTTVRDRSRVKNRLKALYRARGISCTSEVYDPKKRIAWVKKLPESQQGIANIYGEQLDALVKITDAATEALNEQVKPHAVIRMLSTAPGMGVIRTAQVVAIAVTPFRFRTTRQFWSYCGFGVVMRSSADWVRMGTKWVRGTVFQTRGLNRNRNPHLKSVFKAAATTVIQKMPDHPLSVAYQRMLDAGIKPNLAKLTVARRISAAVLAMWKNQETYKAENQQVRPIAVQPPAK